MKFGGPLAEKPVSPENWIELARTEGYAAVFCPLVGLDAADDVLQAYKTAAREAGLVVAEVGAWSNPISSDEATRTAALNKCKQALPLADRIGANCCVNNTGSRGEKWDGPCALDLTEETFQMIVDGTREIVDEVKPTHTYYTLETMPWMYPNSPRNYLHLLNAIDRKQIAVHFDPVNLINSPIRYLDTGTVIREFVDILGPHIKSCHAKDILIQKKLTLHLDEVRRNTFATSPKNRTLSFKQDPERGTTNKSERIV